MSTRLGAWFVVGLSALVSGKTLAEDKPVAPRDRPERKAVTQRAAKLVLKAIQLYADQDELSAATTFSEAFRRAVNSALAEDFVDLYVESEGRIDPQCIIAALLGRDSKAALVAAASGEKDSGVEPEVAKILRHKAEAERVRSLCEKFMKDAMPIWKDKYERVHKAKEDAKRLSDEENQLAEEILKIEQQLRTKEDALRAKSAALGRPERSSEELSGDLTHAREETVAANKARATFESTALAKQYAEWQQHFSKHFDELAKSRPDLGGTCSRYKEHLAKTGELLQDDPIPNRNGPVLSNGTIDREYWKKLAAVVNKWPAPETWSTRCESRSNGCCHVPCPTWSRCVRPGTRRGELGRRLVA